MYRGEIKSFYEENKSYCISFAVVMVVCIAGLWLCHDYFRNEPIYNDTDDSMGRIEERINSIEQRVDTMQNRLEQTQKTVKSIGDRVNTSTGIAKEIESGLGTASERLDSAVQRAGRIQNLIEAIERSNRQRATDSPQTDLAK